jgi:hypothetical protein
MSRYLVDQIEQNHTKIEVHRTTEVRELIGDDTLEQIVVAGLLCVPRCDFRSTMRKEPGPRATRWRPRR